MSELKNIFSVTGFKLSRTSDSADFAALTHFINDGQSWSEQNLDLDYTTGIDGSSTDGIAIHNEWVYFVGGQGKLTSTVQRFNLNDRVVSVRWGDLGNDFDVDFIAKIALDNGKQSYLRAENQAAQKPFRLPRPAGTVSGSDYLNIEYQLNYSGDIKPLTGKTVWVFAAKLPNWPFPGELYATDDGSYVYYRQRDIGNTFWRCLVPHEVYYRSRLDNKTSGYHKLESGKIVELIGGGKLNDFEFVYEMGDYPTTGWYIINWFIRNIEESLALVQERATNKKLLDPMYQALCNATQRLRNQAEKTPAYRLAWPRPQFVTQ